MHRIDSQESIQKVLARQMTGRDVLIRECDEKLWKEDLSEEGYVFTEYYYKSEIQDNIQNYYEDYAQILASNLESIYEVENSWENYDKLKPIIDNRFEIWKLEEGFNEYLNL